MMFETKYKNVSLWIIFDNDGTVTFQRAPYIEDGWYIYFNSDTVKDKYEVWYIPQYGGNDSIVKAFAEFSEAYKFAQEL